MRLAPASAILLALASTACATASDRGSNAAQPGSVTSSPSAAAEAAGTASVRVEAEVERTIAGRRFVRRGEDWYLEANGRHFRVLPDSLSLQFRDGTPKEQRREFLASRGLEVLRSNRLGILDVRTGPDRHAVDWLAELTGSELLALVDVNTEGTYEE